MNPTDRYIRLADATHLPIKQSTLYKWSSKGKHNSIFKRIGGMVFVDVVELEKLIQGGEE